MFIYIFGGDGGYYKVGVARSPTKRLPSLQCGCPFKVRMLYQRECDEGAALRIERLAHTFLSEHRTVREWFRCSLETVTSAVERAFDEDANGDSQLHDSMAVHPGPWLKRNVVDHYQMSVTAAADQLKVTRPAMSNLLNGKAALSPEMAIRFEKAFGIPADTMLQMQTAHDLTGARKHEDEIDVQRLEFA